MHIGSKSGKDRMDAYKAKIRAFSGTGSPPGYTTKHSRRSATSPRTRTQHPFSPVSPAPASECGFRW